MNELYKDVEATDPSRRIGGSSRRFSYGTLTVAAERIINAFPIRRHGKENITFGEWDENLGGTCSMWDVEDVYGNLRARDAFCSAAVAHALGADAKPEMEAAVGAIWEYFGGIPKDKETLINIACDTLKKIARPDRPTSRLR